MALELPIQSIPGLATAGGALIAAMLTYAGLVLAKEQKTSEFRQAWIEGLRGDLGVFFSTVRALCRAIEERNPATVLNVRDAKIDEAAVSSLRLATSESFYKIFLRLNPEEENHRELERRLRLTIRKIGEIAAPKYDALPALEELERTADYSRPLLKIEWKRVKAGEPRFRFLQFALPLTLILVPLVLWWSISTELVKFTREPGSALQKASEASKPLHATVTDKATTEVIC